MVYTSRVPGTRLSSVSSARATWARSVAPRAGSSVHSVRLITGTSSMPIGRTSAWPMPTPGGTQSWFEYTRLYTRTIASRRGTPTSNSTVNTAMPGRLTEYTCLTPSISVSSCSSG